MDLFDIYEGLVGCLFQMRVNLSPGHGELAEQQMISLLNRLSQAVRGTDLQYLTYDIETAIDGLDIEKVKYILAELENHLEIGE